MLQTQLELALSAPLQPHRACIDTPDVWLVSGARGDCDDLRRILAGRVATRRACAFMDLRSGLSTIRPGDVILLKEAGNPKAELLHVPPRSRAATDGDDTRRRDVDASDAQVVSMAMVLFGKVRRRRQRRGWSRSAIERLIDTLGCANVMTRPLLVERICREALVGITDDEHSILRAILHRLRADAAAACGHADADRLYGQAGRAFRRLGMALQERAAAVRRTRHARSAQSPMPFRDQTRHCGFLGFRAIPLSGMRVPSTWKPRSSGRAVARLIADSCALELEDEMVLRLLASSRRGAIVASVRVIERRHVAGRPPTLVVAVTLDDELATCIGFAGAGVSDDEDCVIAMHCRTAAVVEGPMRTTIGGSARFTLVPGARGRHVLDVSVLTGRSPLKMIRFDAIA